MIAISRKVLKRLQMNIESIIPQTLPPEEYQHHFEKTIWNLMCCTVDILYIILTFTHRKDISKHKGK